MGIGFERAESKMMNLQFPRLASLEWIRKFKTFIQTEFTEIAPRNAALAAFFMVIICLYASNPAIASDDARISIAMGESHTVYVLADGTLWAFGKNDRGQLGDGTTVDRRSPVQIGTENDWVEVSAGAAHTIALKTNGTIWAWGDNEFFQTSHPFALSVGEPYQVTIRPDTPVTVNNDWVSIDAGDYHNVALRSDGSLWVWGRNDFGQLGVGDLVAKETPSQLGSDNDWISTAAGAFHTLGVKVNGSVFAWGSNYFGQVGDGTTTLRSAPVQVLIPDGGGHFDNDWVAIDAGGFHSLALKSNGTLWAWGENLSGQLGTFATDSCFLIDDCQKSPRRLGSTPTGPGTENSWSQFAAGYVHSVALKSDGSLWTWGRNDVGQLGDGTVIQRDSPVHIPISSNWTTVAAGGSHTVAVQSDADIFAWGSNEFGQLGDGTASTERLVPTNIDENAIRWVSASTQGNFTVAIRADGSMWAWGENQFGQLGDGTTVDREFAARVGTDKDWVAVAAGPTHVIALKANGAVYGWGRNAFGQLGDGTAVNKLSPTRIGSDNDWRRIAVGSGHTIALKSDGTLWTWGWNIAGQLGDGTNSDRNYPAQVGFDSDWTSVSAGAGHNLALKSDGSLWGWGDGDFGNLGTGNTDWVLAPVQIGSDNDWTTVSNGEYHTLALKADGTLWAWGANYAGQLGRGTTSTYSADPAQVGTDDHWVFARAGGNTSLGIKSDGSRWVWGNNSTGAFGDGTTTNQSTPVRAGLDHDWVFLEASGTYTIALRSDGTIWFSGWNRDGQFGTGNTDDSLTLVRGGILTFADAGPDQFVSFEDPVTLDGSNSTTVVPGGLTYDWYCLQGCGDLCRVVENYVGPIPFSARIVQDIPQRDEDPPINSGDGPIAWPGSGVSPGFDAPTRVGSIVLQLRVTDGYGEFATDEVAVTVFEDANHAVFVSQAGDNSFPGTMEQPVADLTTAVEHASNFRQCANTGAACVTNADCSGFCVAADIYVQEGEYTAAETVNIRNHMSLYGGFATDWTRTSAISSRLEGGATALSVVGVLHETIIDGLHIKSRDGASPTTYEYGENSIAIYVENSTAALKITNNLIESGVGGDGGPAPKFDESAASGAPGGDGEDGFGPGPVIYVETAHGGSGGRGLSGGWPGGDGGACGYECVFEVPGLCAADDGENGQDAFFGGQGGDACADNGGAGRTGTAGVGGAPAAAEGRIIYTGAHTWRGMAGTPGGGGSPGGGGGGGGAGDGSFDWIFIGVVPTPTSTWTGGGGGGGGEGGFGGTGGSAGISGSGSFGIFLAASRPDVFHNQFVTAGGGAGSRGGDGQIGGLGGLGGHGGSGILIKADEGADGGNGGQGGQGGGGGGGAGGPSFGVYEALASSPSLVANCYSPAFCTLPTSNAGVGSGGTGGEGGFPSGQAGPGGLIGETIADGPFVCTDPILPFTGEDPPPDPPIQIDPPCSIADCDLIAGINWGGSEITMTLESPSGRTVDRYTIAEDVIRESGATYERYTILQAEQGVWRVRLFGLDVPPEGERVALSVRRDPINNPPVAKCRDITVAAGPQCQAEASIDDSSFDPDVNDALNIAQSPSGPFDLGEAIVSLTVEDGDGLIDSCEAVVTVVDETAPQVICPADLSVVAGASCQAIVTLTDSVATDACDPSVNISSDAPGIFPLGKTVITYTAVDDSGVAAFCQTRVQVTDGLPPELVCPSNVFISAPATSDMIGAASATDECSGIPTVGNDAPSQLPLGETLVTWVAVDASGNSTTCQQSVVVGDTTPPVVTAPDDINEDAKGVLTQVDIGQATGTDEYGVASLTHDAPEEGFPVGTTVVTWTAIDTSENIGVALQVVTLNNDPPNLASIADAIIEEGGSFTAAASFVDEDSEDWSATVDYGEGEGPQPLPIVVATTTMSLLHVYPDNGVYTVTVAVNDAEGATGTTSFTVTVNNIAPSLNNFIVEPTLAALGANTVSANVEFTDAGVLDTHTASIDWGDGAVTAASVVETNGSGNASGNHTYLSTGVYTVTISVTDKDGATTSSFFQFVVIYDGSGGFVTGGGWIDSPLGACQLSVACTALTGKANFGFVSKYKRGASTPTGDTEFQFKAGDLNFHSDNYEWLVIAGARAMYKGTGNINGAGNYGFMLSAIDADLTPSTDVDLFRIKIWDKDNADFVVYDNEMAIAEDAEPTTQIAGGSIKIHKGK
jgi:alpha-tubulin suppressor-like RCC1 family protein